MDEQREEPRHGQRPWGVAVTKEIHEIAAHIGVEPTSIVDWPGPGEVVRGARPMTAEDARRLADQQRERHIASLVKDEAAIRAREARIKARRRERRNAMTRGHVAQMPRRTA